MGASRYAFGVLSMPQKGKGQHHQPLFSIRVFVYGQQLVVKTSDERERVLREATLQQLQLVQEQPGKPHQRWVHFCCYQKWQDSQPHVVADGMAQPSLHLLHVSCVAQ
jgi:hypothetical protein